MYCSAWSWLLFLFRARPYNACGVGACTTHVICPCTTRGMLWDTSKRTTITWTTTWKKGCHVEGVTCVTWTIKLKVKFMRH